MSSDQLSSHQSRTDSPCISVLHVDDDPALVELTASYFELRTHDISVTSRTSAEEALSHLRRAQIDCVVSDHDMPGMDGLEFMRTVRETHPRLPFIFFTRLGPDDVRTDGGFSDATVYLQKSYDRYSELAERIRTAVPTSPGSSD